jgi:4'-phosphopantetheinyl transferase
MTKEAQRPAGSEANAINERQIHVWHLNLRDEQWDRFHSVLSRDEEEKGRRFRYAGLRENFSRARIALRLVLSRYLGLCADRIEFSYTKTGKPEIASSGIFFNMSHSGNSALIAVALCPVGIDIELARDSKFEEEGIVKMVCHETERAELDMLSPVERRRLFYQLWTRKEAYYKAIGVGLQEAICDLFFQSRDAHRVYQVCSARSGRLPYYVQDLTCPAGYTGSVCVSCRSASIRLMAGSFEQRNPVNLKAVSMSRECC